MTMDDDRTPARMPDDDAGSYVDSELPEDATRPEHDADDAEYDEDDLARTQPMRYHDADEAPGGTASSAPMTNSTDGGLAGGDPGVED